MSSIWMYQIGGDILGTHVEVSGRQLDLEVWSSLKRLQINMLESPYTDVILSRKSECHLLVSIDREGGSFEVEHSSVGC